MVIRVKLNSGSVVSYSNGKSVEQLPNGSVVITTTMPSLGRPVYLKSEIEYMDIRP